MKYTRILLKPLSFLHDQLLAAFSSLSSFSEVIFPRPSSFEQLQKLPKRIITTKDTYFSLYFYQEKSVKDIIAYLKRYDDTSLVKNLAYIMYQELLKSAWYKEKISNNSLQKYVILAVPTTAESFKKYGGRNHIRAFASAFAVIMKLPLLSERTVLKTNTKKQALLSRQERLHNLTDAFTVANQEKIYQKNIIIVDDVWTTGSTLYELSRCLSESGAKNVFAITIAH